jgi:hypothetical protein
MKRLWIALILLIAVTGTSIWNIWYLNHTIRSMTDLLENSLSAARAEDWQQSSESLREAHRMYERSEGILSVTINEKQLDEVCSNFARAQEGSQTDDHAGYRMELSGLLESVDDLLRSEMISLGNLL